MNDNKIKTSSHYARDDLDLISSLMISTNTLSDVDKPKPLHYNDGRVIQMVTAFLLLGITSQALTFPYAIESNINSFTNPTIKELGSFIKSMESKKIITAEEALAFLKSIRLSFGADSFDREEANARR